MLHVAEKLSQATVQIRSLQQSLTEKVRLCHQLRRIIAAMEAHGPQYHIDTMPVIARDVSSQTDDIQYEEPDAYKGDVSYNIRPIGILMDHD